MGQEMADRLRELQWLAVRKLPSRELKHNVSKGKFDILFGIEVNEILWNYVFPRDLD